MLNPKKILRIPLFLARQIRNYIGENKRLAVYDRYKNFTMIPPGCYYDNLHLASTRSSVKGAIVECGVWRGGMIAGIAETQHHKNIYLCDSFEGLPPVKEIDGESAKQWQNNTTSKHYFNNCKAEESYATDAMRLSGNANYHLIKGWFNDTLPELTIPEGISILRLDGDWYDSTMVCLKYLLPQMNKGGVIIIDDYYAWDGCSKAIHDYLSQHHSNLRIRQLGQINVYIEF